MTVTFTDATGGTPFDGESSVAVTGAITGENTITGTLPTITNPRLTADVVARVTVALANGSCAFFHDLANFVAPPTITTVTNLRAPFDQSDPTGGVGHQRRDQPDDGQPREGQDEQDHRRPLPPQSSGCTRRYQREDDDQNARSDQYLEDPRGPVGCNQADVDR